jgi:hypothetical protein
VRAALAALTGGALAGALLLTGCSRRAASPAASNSPGDTLANGVPRALAAQMSAWVGIWRQANPAFATETLVRGATRPYKFYSLSERAGRFTSGVRSKAGIAALSPDSTRLLDFDAYVDFTRGPDGAALVEREADSTPTLADFGSDTLWHVAFCGTPCFYDGGYWIDASRFALTGAMQTGAQADGPWAAFLETYDLRTRLTTLWSADSVGEGQFARYQDAMDADLARRIERAGFGRVDSTGGRRAALENP